MYKTTLIIFIIFSVVITTASYAQDSTLQKAVARFDDRMNIAVFPFENKDVSQELVEEIVDELITAFIKQDRFNVINRNQLNKIVQQRHLELLWKIDIPIAAEIGREYFIEGICLATISSSGTDSINIDAFILDAQSRLIIISHGVVAKKNDALSLEKAAARLAAKIAQSIPVVEGSVIQINDDYTVLLDGGKNSGLRRGMRCTFFREGVERIDPVSGKKMDRDINIIGEALIVESLEKVATAQILNAVTRKAISAGDMYQTK